MFCFLVSAEGFYVYHECDNVSNGQKARLLSASLSSTASHICVQFQYYMYGTDNQNVLRLLSRSGSSEKEVWKRTGMQSPSWLKGSVTVSSPVSQVSVDLRILIRIHRVEHVS